MQLGPPLRHHFDHAARAGVHEIIRARARDPVGAALETPNAVVAQYQQRKGDDHDHCALERAETKAKNPIDRPHNRAARSTADVVGDEFHRGIGDQQQQREGQHCGGNVAPGVVGQRLSQRGVEEANREHRQNPGDQ